jgi:hypothetical protein
VGREGAARLAERAAGSGGLIATGAGLEVSQIPGMGPGLASLGYTAIQSFLEFPIGGPNLGVGNIFYLGKIYFIPESWTKIYLSGRKYIFIPEF